MQMQVNLLPVQYRPKPTVRVWPIVVSVVLTLNLLVISTYWLTLQLELSSARSSLTSLQGEVKSLQRAVEETQWKAELSNSVALKRDYIITAQAQGIIWVPLLEAIERAMVPGIVITSINNNEQGETRIAGLTESVTAAADFLGSLQAETGLSSVHLLGAVPGEGFIINMQGWSGLEVQADE